MCYSSESSINSFLIGISSCIYLLIYGDKYDKHIGFYFIPVILIQLIEYFMWIDQRCGKLNHYASKSVNLVLSSQVYFLILGFYLFKTSIIINKYKKNKFNILILITILYLYIGLKSYFINEGILCSKPNKYSSLVWDKWKGLELNNKYVGYIIYYGLFILSFMLFSHKWKGKLIIILGIIFIIKTIILYNNYFYSRYCFLSAGIPILFVILNLIKGIK